jgi:hypothetical protein
MSSPFLSPSSAAAAYAEPFVDGRRVVIFGDSEAALAQLLLERGARSVHVYDNDEQRVARARAANASRNISFGKATELGVGQDRAFDFGIVENLADSPTTETLQALVNALAIRGAALVGVPNAEARLGLGLSASTRSPEDSLDYYELYDLVAEHFSEVRMLGQLPFVGYAIADFSAQREADISVDTAFVPGGAEEPEWFWALCSQEPVMGEAFSIIQLPAAQALAARAATSSDKSPAKDSAKDGKDKDMAAQAAQLAELKTKLTQREQALAESNAQLSKTNQRAAALEADLTQLRAKAASEDIETERARWQAERDHLAARLSQAEQALRSDDQQDTAQADEDKSAVANEVSTLEGALRERAEHVTVLEARLVEAERVVGDLVRELEMLRQRSTQVDPPAAVSSELSELKSKLDNLALANAERATLLASAEATIQELEHKVQQMSAAAATSGQDVELAQSDVQRQLTLTAQQQASSTGELPS